MTASLESERTPPAHSRVNVEVHHVRPLRERLSEDVRIGLGKRPYRLPPKYFYDDAGSRLFDAICDTPEYYLTRAETTLLQRVASTYVALTNAHQLVELGSGAARKTRLLLDALTRRARSPQYVPVDVSETMLRESAMGLARDFPSLEIHGIVDDYEHGLPHWPDASRRLVAFLGSSIGNFEPDESREFLARIASTLRPDDAFVMGVDLVKDPGVLHRAYNDAQGVTAEFNRNVLRVINAELDADFVPSSFEHVAFYDPARERIEMHLRAIRSHAVRVASLGMDVPFEAGETIHTEISRKFTRDGTTALLVASGFDVIRWDTSPGDAFALVLARASAQA